MMEKPSAINTIIILHTLYFMSTIELIPLNTFCVHNNIEVTFINSLEQSGLIEIIKVQETAFIHEDRIGDIEKYVRLHYDLDINLEGIEAINYLLLRVEDLQRENIRLKNKLRLYEKF